MSGYSNFYTTGYSNFYTTSEDTTAITVFGILFYGALLGLVILLILVFVHFTITPIFALTVNDPGIVTLTSGIGDREMAYTTLPGPLVSRVSSLSTAPFTTLPPICTYTIGLDVYDTPGTMSRIDKSYPILYRDTLANKQGLVGYDIDLTSYSNQVKTLYGNTNIIVWMNDARKLVVSLVTYNASGAYMLQSLDPIQVSKPLTQLWYRLTIVMGDTFAEVYINGNLQGTIVTAGNTIMSLQNTDFYPPPVAFSTQTNGGSVAIANMAMWPRLLTSKEIRTYEGAPVNKVAPVSTTITV